MTGAAGERRAAPADWTIHGGRLAQARRAWPDAPLPWIDLSTGINPHAWPAGRAGPIDWRRLPDDAALAGLEAAAAAAFGVPAERVCATPGSEMALRLLPGLDLPRPWRHLAPGYATHGEALPGSEAIAPDAIGSLRGGTLLMARPANPQGRSFLLPGPSVLPVIDEAFADALPAAGPPPRPPLRPDRIVLRSFGKFYGLAGVRLGFVVAAPERLAPLRARMGSWPLSAAAIVIGTAAYRDLDWRDAMRDRLVREAAALDRVLRRHGLEPEGECPLFRLVRAPDASALFERLARRGILTRPFAYDRRWLRVGLPAGRAALDRLDRALAGAP